MQNGKAMPYIQQNTIRTLCRASLRSNTIVKVSFTITLGQECGAESFFVATWFGSIAACFQSLPHPGSCGSQITICIPRWLLQVPGIVPPPQWAPNQKPWILCCTTDHQLLAQPDSGLVVNMNTGLGYAKHLSGLQQLISNSRETIHELDALYIIRRARWMKDIVNGVRVPERPILKPVWLVLIFQK